MPLEEVLGTIRARPGVVLGQKSVEILEAFLTGYTYATQDPEDLRFLSGFTDWLRRHYHIKSSQGWAKIIRFYSADDVETLDLFWKLLDEYRGRGSQTPDAISFDRQGKRRRHGRASAAAQPAPGRSDRERANDGSRDRRNRPARY
jgi:hypothetical protein